MGLPIPGLPVRPVDSRNRPVNTIANVNSSWSNMTYALGWQLQYYFNLLTIRTDETVRKLGDRS